MRVLVDVGHPAQVHFFKNLVGLLARRGHEVLVTARSKKDVTTELLDALDIPYECLGNKGVGFTGMAAEFVTRAARMVLLVRKFRPDVMLAQTGVTIGPVGAMLNIPRIVLEEAEHAWLQRAVGLPFATRILTGDGYLCDHGRCQVRFRGFWVHAYLDERYFKPNPQTLRRVGVNPDEPYIVLRTVSWSALHDITRGMAGQADVRRTIENLSRFGRVIVSSEDPLPESLKEYENPVPVQHMHDLLAFASMYIGDGGTMAAEAAVLGTPTVYCSPLHCGYLLALADDCGLIRITNNLTEGVTIATRLLEKNNLKDEWRQQHAKLSQCEDITERMYEVIESVVVEKPTAVTARIEKQPPSAHHPPDDYAWSSITMGTTNAGNHLIEWSLREALELNEPALSFDSFKPLTDALIHRINRECRFVLSPGCTVFEPGQNEAYMSFDAMRVPTPCFGGCFWPEKKGTASGPVAMLARALNRGKRKKNSKKTQNVVENLSEPVGCRDPYTHKALQNAGIEAKLVGCPTLMAPEPVTKWRHTGGKHIVMSLSRQSLLAQCKLILKLRRSWHVSVLVHEFYEKFPLRLMRDIDVIEFASAEQFMDIYAHADLVVTGRLHGVLPAIRCGTPVLFYGDRADTRFSLLSFLGITIHELSSELADAAGRSELTAPEGATFEKLSELRRAFVDYARSYGIGTKLKL